MCEKEFSDSTFNLAVIGKISIFQEIAPNFTYRKRFNFLSIIEFFYTNCFYPIHLMAVACEEYSFSILPVVSR